jgi:hypothetical protein
LENEKAKKNKKTKLSVGRVIYSAAEAAATASSYTALKASSRLMDGYIF